MFKFNVGDEVKDLVTGYKGIVVARSQYLTGCNRYGIMSQKLASGKPDDWQHFDEHQLTLIKKEKIKLEGEKETIQKGGPQPSARKIYPLPRKF